MKRKFKALIGLFRIGFLLVVLAPFFSCNVIDSFDSNSDLLSNSEVLDPAQSSEVAMDLNTSEANNQIIDAMYRPDESGEDNGYQKIRVQIQGIEMDTGYVVGQDTFLSQATVNFSLSLQTENKKWIRAAEWNGEYSPDKCWLTLTERKLGEIYIPSYLKNSSPCIVINGIPYVNWADANFYGNGELKPVRPKDNNGWNFCIPKKIDKNGPEMAKCLVTAVGVGTASVGLCVATVMTLGGVVSVGEAVMAGGATVKLWPEVYKIVGSIFAGLNAEYLLTHKAEDAMKSCAIQYGYATYPNVYVQIDGNDKGYSGYNIDNNTYLKWTYLETWGIDYKDLGNGNFIVAGKNVKGEVINRVTYLNWKSFQDKNHKLEARSISKGWNFVWVSTSDNDNNGGGGGGGGSKGPLPMPL